MIRQKNRNYLLAVVATLALLGGCKGESPTSPTSNPTPPGGNVTPTTGAAVSLAVSNATPQVNSSSVITATVTQNGQPVPNGTAVEFTTDLGTFTEANGQTMIRTTTNGIATATLASSAAGPANVTATVNNVSAKTKVTFSSIPQQPQPPDLSPQITGISPTQGVPQGGTVVTITGKNFANPKVIFDFGGGVTVPGFIQSSTATTIQVLTPSVDLGTGQQKTANIVVINNAGSPNEVTVTAGTPFTYQSTVLTPKITTVSPASGPIDGGTRVTIFGEGFQAPLQVFFGSAEAQVVSAVTFNQLTVIAPAASTTTPAGSGNVTGPVDVKIINIASATNVTATGVFRYIAKVQVTAAGPTVGPSDGGTRIEIDGAGFNDPVTVTVAGVGANVISVSGSKIIAITSPVLLSSCANVTGPIIVSNVDNGDAGTGPPFTYVVNKTAIVGISPNPVTAGSSLQITIQGQSNGNQVKIGDQTAFITSAVPNGNGTTTLTVTVPAGLPFATQACSSGGATGTIPVPLTTNVTVTNTISLCTDVATNSIKVNPISPTCTVGPPPQAIVTPAIGCADAGFATVGNTATSTISITNGGGQPLIISGAAIGGTNPGDFTIAPTNASVPPGSAQTFTVTFKPTATGPRSATVTFSTNDPNASTITKCLTGTGG